MITDKVAANGSSNEGRIIFLVLGCTMYVYIYIFILHTIRNAHIELTSSKDYFILFMEYRLFISRNGIQIKLGIKIDLIGAEDE